MNECEEFNQSSRRGNVKVIIKDGIDYFASNKRMRFHPDFHTNHRLRWLEEEIIYLCQMKNFMTLADLGMALGKTPSACSEKYARIKKSEKLEYYLNIRD